MNQYPQATFPIENHPWRLSFPGNGSEMEGNAAISRRRIGGVLPGESFFEASL
jgi:hypothetical protein